MQDFIIQRRLGVYRTSHLGCTSPVDSSTEESYSLRSHIDRSFRKNLDMLLVVRNELDTFNN